jgi:NCS1 family nucleobase:cation symporter-1
MANNKSNPASAGAIETNDVAPIPAGERHGKPWHLFTVWSSPNLEFATVFVGALAIIFGLDLWSGILAVVVGNALAAITHGILSTWGPEAGLPQMVLGRTAFGKLGNLIPAGLSTLVAGIGWFAVNTVSGSLALTSLVKWNLGISLAVVILAQIAIAFIGHNLIQKWERFTSYGLALVWIIVLIVVLPQGHYDGVANHFNWASFTLAAGAAYGYTAGWTPFASDYTRYLPANSNKRSLGWFAGLGNFFSTTLLMGLGVVAWTLVAKGSPTDVFVALLPNWLAPLTLLAIAVGSVSANVLNVYSGAMSFLAMGFKLGFKTRRAIMVALAGVIGGVVAVLAANNVGHLGDNLEGFLLVVSYWVAPWIAIVLVDRFMRKGADFGALALSARENLAGPIAFVVAAGFSIWGFANQQLYTGPLAKQYGVGDITAIVGFVVAAVLYFVLAKALKTDKK